MSERKLEHSPWPGADVTGRLKRRNRWLGVFFLLFVLGIIALSLVIFSKHGFPPHW